MLELRRLRLLRELAERGTIAAVAEALQFTPSAVSQQLAMLEREAGVQLLERAGRGVRLTDAALVLVDHAEALLERAALAEADLAAAAGTVAGRVRIAGFESVLLRRGAVPLAELANEAWTTGHAGMGWDEMTRRTCRELGGFDPDIRHRTNDATVSVALVARGQAVAMLPKLP